MFNIFGKSEGTSMRRSLLVVIGLLALGMGMAPAAEAQLSKVCKKILSVPGSHFVYKNSAPLRNSRGAIAGFRTEPTLIMKRNYGRGTTTIYDSKGKSIGRCPWADAHGFSGGRWRCTMQTGALRRTAVKNTKKPNIYFKLSGNQCAHVSDAGRCYGSVKGLCNRTIK